MSDPSQLNTAIDEPMPDIQEEYFQPLDPEKITIVRALNFNVFFC